MDFDLSKENIQPLRGGRNVTQLEVGLQAQSDSELQKELLQQKESFDEAIRTYEGDDPLENWYNYIYWVEQSYPKHGHEGNLVRLLEDCLSKFEHENKYIHDRRLCKLWIKYIDLQQNPLELFQLLHSKGICVSCADLYRAWAYYHEVAGDHKRADVVFDLGISVLAQPYEDLVLARNNMYTAIGKQAITGVDERRLVEQRHALTSLRPYIQRRTTMVTSVRTGSQVVASNTPGVLQQNLLRPERNAPVTLYEDQAVAGPSVGGANGTVSILDVARRQEVVHKENALKPGPWNTKKSTISTRVGQQRAPGFKIHVDDEPAPAEGIRLPSEFAPMNHDDFSTWKTLLFFPEPANPNHIPMYPKHLVYAEPDCEYSLEEIRARKWFARRSSELAVAAPVNASMNMQETIMADANILSCSQHIPLDCQPTASSSDSISQSTQSSGNSKSPLLPSVSNANSQSIPSSSNLLSQSIPSASNTISQPQVFTQNYANISIHQQHTLQNASASSVNVSPHIAEGQHPSSGGLQQRATIYQKQHSQEDEVANAPYHVENYNVQTVNQNQLTPSFPNYSLQNYASEDPYSNLTQNCPYKSQQHCMPEDNGQSIRQSFQYQATQQNADAHNQSLRQQAVPNYSSETGQRFRQYTANQAALNYDFESENPSLRQSSSQYHLPVQNYASNQSLRHSAAGKNVLYQDQSTNNTAEMFIHQQAYAAEPSVPIQSYSSEPTGPSQLYTAQTTVPVYQQPVIKTTPTQCWPNSTLSSDDNYTVNMREAIRDINDIWKDNLSALQEPVVEVKKPVITKFQIHEDTEFLRDDARDQRKSAVKTVPFAVFSDDGGSASSCVLKSGRRLQEITQKVHNNDPIATNAMQHNLKECSKPGNKIKLDGYEELAGRTPYASQPLPDTEFSLRPSTSHSQPSVEMRKSAAFPVFQNSSAAAAAAAGAGSPLNDTCTTQMFNFNLNSLQAHSTPFHSRKTTAPQQQQHYANATYFGSEEEEANSRAAAQNVLFYAQDEEGGEKAEQSFVPQEETRMQEKLSVILETTKEYRSSSSSSSGGTTLKTTTFNFRESLKAIPETSVQSCNESGLELKGFKADDVTVGQFGENNEDVEKSTINDYSMIKELLRSGEDNEQKYRPSVMIIEDCSHRENISYLPTHRLVHPHSQIIDLTDDDNNKAHKNEDLMRFSEAGGSLDFSRFNVQSQDQKNKLALVPNKNASPPSRNQRQTFESPRKNLQFYENSNDSMSCSPVKGSRMEVDTVLKTQNSQNSQFKMDCDSCQEAPAGCTKEDLPLQEALSDPFASKLITALLNKVGFPSVKYAKNYIPVQGLPRIGKKEVGKKDIICLGEDKYLVEKVIGKGAYGTVYKAVNESTNAMVALKLQKPANKWEYYICKEIQARTTNPYLLNAFMDVSTCYVSHNGSVLVSDFCKLGSLLDLTNKVKQVTGKGVKELVAIYYANEIITLVNALHQCRIIHADIKPDNFLVTRIPPEYGRPSLQLIDFGCSIDMSLFPPGTTFTKAISTENFTCTEMKDGRPWTYQTDIFCVAATVHVMLFEKYMQVQKRGDVWSIAQNIPRYMRKDLWNTFFFQMLNIDGCDKLPDLNAIKASFDFILSTQSEELQVDMRFVANSIYGR